MAYPTIDKPYGFKPVNLQGGRVYSGSTRMFPITNGLSTSIYNGDVVSIANGVLANVATAGTYNAATASITPTAGVGLGVFVGCEYSSTGGPIYGKNRYQYWAANTAANDAVGYVVDDPLAYFRVAVIAQGTSISNTGTTIGYMNPYFVGTNANLVCGNGGVNATGASLAGISGDLVPASNPSGSIRLTGKNTPFRIVQIVPDTAYTYTSTVTSSTSSGSTVTISAADTNIKPGMQFVAVKSDGTYVSGCAPGNYNTVLTNASSTTFTTSTAVGASLSGATLTFIGYPEVIVGWNSTFHAYNVVGGA